MNIINTFLDSTFWISFFTAPNNIVFFIIIFIIILYHISSQINLKKSIKQIPGHEINQKIINSVSEINKKINSLNSFKESSELNIRNIFVKLKEIKNIKIIRYNPYQDMGVGGNQSFSVGIIDENKNGIILTSLYSRERNRVLIKKIENGQSEKELMPEEIELLKMFTNNY